MLAFILIGAAVLLALLRFFAADVYDIVFVHMTNRWYRCVLEKLPSRTRLLDVGVGTATALINNRDLLVDMRVVGIDYDEPYIVKGKASVNKAMLDSVVDLHCMSVYDGLESIQIDNEPFDAAYFSGSLMIMPDPTGTLRAIQRVIKKGGLVYVTQTFQKPHPLNPVIAKVKPVMKYVTTIDFGQMTSVEDFLATAEAAGMRVVEDRPIPESVINSFQVARIIVLTQK